jgi:2-polyprenyl-3-methyl-5-hydroxy-6-metoxy-1,4-benzoquinol methylase
MAHNNLNEVKRKFVKTAKASVYATRLPDYIHYFETHINRLSKVLDDQEAMLQKLKMSVDTVNKSQEDTLRLLNNVQEKISELKHREIAVKSSPSPEVAINNTMADDHSHDSFYKSFEDRFRGDETTIKSRLTEYEPYLASLPTKLRKLPVVDLGCGRGEFLYIAKKCGFKPIGIDMNKDMVKRAKALGFTAHESDALTFLLSQKSSSLSVISGFHLVEHIPFPSLLKIFSECFRTINPEGFVLFETPNPNNLTVGSSNFYMDPSHIKPIPPKLLAFALETQGFFTQILELHPAKEDIHHNDPVVEDMMRMLYGPVDYAVLATKKPFKLSGDS